MKYYLPFVLISLMCVFSNMSANAQEEESEMLYIEDMHLRADKDVGYGEESSFLIWHGYLNFEFDKKQGQNSTFDNHEFYLSAHSDLSEKLSVTAEFEYEHNPEKLILPIQAYADFKFSDALIIRNGLFYVPIGMPRSYNLRGNKNRMIRQVAVTHDIMYENWSDVGIEVMGQFSNGIFYDFAIGNGMPNTILTGDSWFDAVGSLQSHTEDNNENKALYGRIGYHSRKFLQGEINFGGSYGYEKYDDDNSLEMIHKALDLRYLHKSGFRIQAELMERSGDELADTNNVSIDAYGWYAQISKRFVGREGSKYLQYIEPAFQVDFIDVNRHYENNRDLVTYAIAFIYSPIKNYMIKLEYDIVDEYSGEKIDNNMFWAAIVVEF